MSRSLPKDSTWSQLQRRILTLFSFPLLLVSGSFKLTDDRLHIARLRFNFFGNQQRPLEGRINHALDTSSWLQEGDLECFRFAVENPGLFFDAWEGSPLQFAWEMKVPQDRSETWDSTDVMETLRQAERKAVEALEAVTPLTVDGRVVAAILEMKHILSRPSDMDQTPETSFGSN